MQFCKDCGTVLNIFGSEDRELCSSCIQHKKSLASERQAPPPIATASDQKETKSSEPEALELFSGATINHESQRLVLKSREGWELWSGPANSITELATIIKKARRIYEIRLKRQENKKTP